MRGTRQKKKKNKRAIKSAELGADDGNRTRMTSLEDRFHGVAADLRG
jgi:hypothetical protein